MWRVRDEICPAGYRPTGATDETRICTNDRIGEVRGRPYQCEETPIPTTVGNPCDALTGAKTESETDYSTDTIRLSRSYNSHAQLNYSMGPGWMHYYERRLVRSDSWPYSPSVLVRPSGAVNFVNGMDLGPDFVWQSTSGNGVIVKSEGANYRAYLTSGSTELYDGEGRLIAMTDVAGRTTTITNNPDGTIDTVTGPFGKRLMFQYQNPGQLSAIVDPAGELIQYGYNASGVLTSVTYQDGSVKQYHYEDTAFPSHLTGVTDENGTRHSTFSYDTSGRAASTELAGGFERLTLEYFPTQTVVTDAAGNQKTYQFTNSATALRKLTAVFESSTTTTVVSPPFSVDSQRRVTQLVDADGIVTEYEYDDFHLIRMTEARGEAEERVTSYEYLEEESRLITSTIRPSVSSGRTTTIDVDYGGDKLPDSVTANGFTPSGDPVQRTTSFTYNTNGQLESIDGPRNNVADVEDVTTIDYWECITGSECGQMRRLTNAAGHITTFDVYDEHGRLTQATDPNGVLYTYTYDLRGRIETFGETPVGGTMRVTTFDYDLAGQLETVTDPAGVAVSMGYTDAHYLESVSDLTGNEIRYDYDSRGNEIQQTHEAAGQIRFRRGSRFDVFNRQDRVFLPDPLGGADDEIEYVRDVLGRITSETSPLAKTTTYELYDALSRLTRIVDAGNGVIQLAYDVHDNIDEVIAPNGASTTYQFDDFGRMIQETSPDRGTTTYVYDAADNPVQQTNALGQTVSTTYDALNRPLTINNVYVNNGASATEQIQLTWDTATNGIGRLARAEVGSGLVDQSYSYDGFGRLATETLMYQYGVDTVQISYEYDAADRLTDLTQGTLTDPSLFRIRYSYDAAGRVSGIEDITSGTAAIVSSVDYAPFGPREQMTFGNGLQETRVYDQRYRLGSLSLSGASGGTSVYGWSADDNLLSLTDGYYFDVARSFSYDNLDRLRTDADPEYRVTYQYDANGNRTRYKVSDVDTGEQDTSDLYSYTANGNRLESVEDLLSWNPYFEYPSHDAAGRLTDADISRPGKVFDHDGLGRLRIAREDIGAGRYLAYYDYGANGARVAKDELDGSGDVTLYSYAPDGRLIGELVSNGSQLLQQRSYVWLEDTPVAMRVADLQAGTSETYYLHTDHLDTVRLATESGGNVSWRWNQRSAFGEGYVLAYSQYPMLAPMNLRFPGQYFDRETGFNYNYFRTYDPSTGRYLESDPIGLDGGLNTYGYVDGNPLSWTDSLGLANDFGTTTGLPLEWQQKVTQDRVGEPAAKDQCIYRCMLKKLGIADGLNVASGAAATPISKSALGMRTMPGASQYTNAMSASGHVTGYNPKIGTQILGTNRVFGLLGRLNLVAYVGLTSYNVTQLAMCKFECDENGCTVE